MQDPYLFTGDIAENIRLGTRNISDAVLQDAAERVNLKDFIDRLPDGYHHQVRERGAGLVHRAEAAYQLRPRARP